MQDHEQTTRPSAEPDQHRYVRAFIRERGGHRPSRNSSADAESREAFVRSLQAKIERKLSSHIDHDEQVEIAGMMRLLLVMPWKAVNEHRVYFELAFDLLARDKPNLILIRNLRFELSEVKDRSGGWFSRLLSRICGDGPLHAVISGLLVGFVMSFVVVALLIVVNRYSDAAPDGLGSELLLFDFIPKEAVTQLIILVHAAFIGSVVSVIARLRDFISVPEFSPLLVFLSVVSRPFISVMFSIFAYVMMKAGVISFLGIDLGDERSVYLVWGIGFLCGFSERLAQDFMVRAGAAFGEMGGPPNSKPPA